MTRAEAVTFLAARLRTLAADLGVTASDNAAGYGNAIDQALRAMGVAEGDLASATVTTYVPAFQALATYYAIEDMELLAGDRVDISVSDVGISKSRSQLFDALQKLKASWQARAAALGFPPPGDGMTVLIGSVVYSPDPYAATVLE